MGVVKLQSYVIGAPAGTLEMMNGLAGGSEHCFFQSRHEPYYRVCRYAPLEIVFQVELCLWTLDSSRGLFSVLLQPGSEVSRASSLRLNIYPCQLERSLPGLFGMLDTSSASQLMGASTCRSFDVLEISSI